MEQEEKKFVCINGNTIKIQQWPALSEEYFQIICLLSISSVFQPDYLHLPWRTFHRLSNRNWWSNAQPCLVIFHFCMCSMDKFIFFLHCQFSPILHLKKIGTDIINIFTDAYFADYYWTQKCARRELLVREIWKISLWT